MKRSSAARHEVIILWGGEEVENFYDHASWTPETARRILEHVAVYEYATEDEAEAFREGLCAVVSVTARDFTEITGKSYQALHGLAFPQHRKSLRKSA